MKKVLNESTKTIEVINSYKNQTPFVISIPHSGIYITKEMNDNMMNNVILSNSDWYLNDLYSFLRELGFTVIINNVNRYVIDPNRELSFSQSDNYCKSLMYLKTTFNKDIYKIPPTKDVINERINKYYNDYHNELRKQIESKLEVFNKVILIDLHSFGKDIDTDVVLGNDNNNTMNKDTFSIIKKCFINNGFSVSENIPYKGGYITKKYGSSNGNCESIQIELSYKKYIDDREFIEEELPKINKTIMENCQSKLKEVFISILNVFESY